MSVSPPVAPVSARSSPTGSFATAAVLLILMLAASFSVDVVRTGFGIKGDEATYVAMALSVAFDGDLRYERKDLERFEGLYRSGPEGIFLKRGKEVRLGFLASPPFVQLRQTPDRRADRLYFGKALIYPVFAAPFVRLAGLNGFYLFHTLLVFGVLVCGYQFLVVRSNPVAALVFTLAFVGATVVPVYTVFLTSDVFNFALVFFGYFLWLYKEVAPEGSGFLRSRRSDIGAAVLLGLATFSKPINVLLIGPLVALWWWRRQWWPGLLVGVVFTLATAGLFGINALSSGEFNYQGGDRKTFYGRFPFDGPDTPWDRVSTAGWDRGTTAATDDADTENVLAPAEFAGRFGHNVEYFFVGRHSGFIPYYFPGFLALCLWLASPERFRAWRVLAFMAFTASAVGLLVVAPYTWNGGGGPPGNRYLLSLYPVVFFLTPPLPNLMAPMIAWVGGALFTAHMVVNPFIAAKFTYLMTERGAARRLPVELTMAGDLPVVLAQPLRARIPYRNDPLMLLYFLDQNAFPPEPTGMWIAGGRRADIIVRTEDPMDHLQVTAESPIRTTLTVSLGAKSVTVSIIPNTPVNFSVPARGARAQQSYAYLLSATSSDGFTPHLKDPSSADYRNLGALMRFAAVTVTPTVP
jgi:hypothetical protein